MFRVILICIIGTLFCFSSLGQACQPPKYNYTKADSIAEIYLGHSLDNIFDLADKLTQPLSTQPEQFRAIYKWVCENISNDYQYYLENKTKRERFADNPIKLQEWDRSFKPKVFEKLLKEKKTVCTGFAYLVKEMAVSVGIPGEIVNGQGRTLHTNTKGSTIPNHSWNAVKLEGQWYLCDPTWSSGVINPEEGQFIKTFSEGYFLADPHLFWRNHYPLDTAWLLMQEKPSQKEFLTGPLLYKDAFNFNLEPLSPSTFTNLRAKKAPFKVVISSPVDLTNGSAEVRIKSGDFERTLKDVLINEGDNRYSFTFIPAFRGTYDVHLVVDNHYIMTYLVIVGKS